MVAYKDVASLPVEQLLSSADAPFVVTPQTSVADTLIGLTERRHGIALVKRSATDFRSVSLEQLREATEAVGGDARNVQVDSVVGNGESTEVFRVPGTMTIAGLAERGTPNEILIVTDPKSGEPQAVINRTQLAGRIRGLVS
ncbi:hypothetical protein ACFYW6_28005 [Streptomyces sp. NPDC002659]|uniref:hypothetical protein n=1 Tax=Streptomyces sp. NPDC002659 TaxID=3364656 RepID=UPI0036A7DC95